MPSSSGIPEAVQRLIIEDIESISQLETLLLLHRVPGRAWTARQVSTELRIDPKWAEEQLELLESRGFLDAIGQEPAYRFHAATPELATAVAALAECYAERRVTVISLLASRPSARIRVLADAFRLRKDD